MAQLNIYINAKNGREGKRLPVVRIPALYGGCIGTSNTGLKGGGVLARGRKVDLLVCKTISNCLAL